MNQKSRSGKLRHPGFLSCCVVGYTEMCIQGSDVGRAVVDDIKSHKRRSVSKGILFLWRCVCAYRVFADVCVANSCQRQVTRSVQCRYATECPQNYYCDNDGTCKQTTQPKQSCPSACCDGDPRY